MTVELSLAPEVGRDISAAYSWYNDRRIGLGEEFLTCVDACIQSICRKPEMHPIVINISAGHWSGDFLIQFL